MRGDDEGFELGSPDGEHEPATGRGDASEPSDTQRPRPSSGHGHEQTPRPAKPAATASAEQETRPRLAAEPFGLPCVHCGLCLDTCPTYRLLGTEGDSPRGRIYIMESVRSGEIALEGEAAEHLSRCLGCLACETACPSGVSFGRRMEEFRPLLAERGGSQAVRRQTAQQIYGNSRVVGLGLRAAHVVDRLGLGRVRRRIPGFGLLPTAAKERTDPLLSPLRRSRTMQPLRARARVALLTGCVGDQLAPDINRDTVEVLQRNGIEIVEAPGQGCCGALALHSGRPQEAADLAARNVEAFASNEFDFLVTTAAGCGAMMHEYAHVLAGTPQAEAAATLATRCRDISELLVELGFEKPAQPLSLGTVAYHDACHLLHARGVSRAPRLVVEAATGAMPVDLGDNQICCGSAGSYNLDHPALADQLGRNKAELARRQRADVVAVGNIGCMMQIARHLALAGHAAHVAHPIQLLAAAYRASS